ncbi:glycosyltransferase [Homoserinimonas sp. OAct 916]|uniref:glycosyltransferase n=1 Tax=Homoserinimonas sp. OAct 916 TaxID=2211450 RepID=UPI001E297FAB|nr:glycosyltransferase [Homoserinimonas sp. OAct 916]
MLGRKKTRPDDEGHEGPDRRFSLLLPVYAGDKADYFTEAFTSAVNLQTLKPDEVILVQDGPISVELDDAMEDAIENSPVTVLRVLLDENLGLANALTVGLTHCTYDIVARMDADDIALPNRFEVQIPRLVDGGLDLLGAGLLEFAESTGEIGARRTPPVGTEAIVQASRFRDPFNHPTVVYRKSAVKNAGGYRDLGLMEDYWLFARMIHKGAVVDNVPDALVMYRVGDGAYARRGGWSQLRAETALQREFLRSGFVSRRQYLRNVAIRGGYRLVPESLRKIAYRRFFTGGDEG